MLFAIATLRAAAKIHQCLLENTMRLPTVFFDTTPIGRILARFSSDINGVDGMLPMTFQMVLNNGLRVSHFNVSLIFISRLYLDVLCRHQKRIAPRYATGCKTRLKGVPDSSRLSLLEDGRPVRHHR